MLLLTSALFVSIASVTQPPEKAHAATLILASISATSGKYGDVILLTFTGVTPTVPDGTSCSISGPIANVVTGAVAQVFSSVVYGSFMVGNAKGNTGSTAYTITVSCTYGSTTDSGTTSFTVTPSVTLSPSITKASRVITVSGYGFASDANGLCTLSGTGVATSLSCSISSGVLTGSFTSGITGTVTVTPLTGLPGSATGGITIVIGPTISLSTSSTPPGYGTTGTSYRVMIVGGGFTNGTRSCGLTQGNTAAPPGLIDATSCSINSDGTVTASFSLSSTAPVSALYKINVTDTTYATTAQASFTVTLPPVLTIGGGSVSAGHWVTVTHTVNVFSALDAGPCTVLSNPSALVSSPFCLIDNSGNVWLGAVKTAKFVVSANAPNLLPSSYKVTIMGVHGDSSNSTTLAPTYNPAVAFAPSPVSGFAPTASLPGTTVTIHGTGWNITDTTCTIASNPTTLIPTSTSYTCGVTGSTGVLTGTFVVPAQQTNGTYILTVTGNSGDHLTSVNFYVDPRIVLSPTSGIGGQTITVLGSGFKATIPCDIEAWQAGSIVPPSAAFSGTPSCSDDSHGLVTGSFTVGSVLANGVYTIKVGDTTPGTDNATATFTKGVLVALTLSPYSGPPGTGSVSVTGTFTSADAGACTIVAPAGSNLFSGVPTPTCTISSSGALTASFTVSTTAQGGTWAVQVYGAGGGFGSGNFAVTPVMTLTPASGESFTLVSVAGSGFSAADAVAGCASLYSTPLGLLISVSCSISATTYLMSGSFVVSGTVAPGSYSVKFLSSLGLVSATPAFTKSASAFDLVPNSGPAGTIVIVTGSGFTTTDTSCAITASPNIVASQTCSITGGVVTGSFTVVGAAAPGVSTVTVTSNPSGTSKSAPFQLTPTIVLSVNSGRAGTVVSVSGSNFATSDAGCAITSSPSGLITSPSCILVAGAMSGSFTVAVVSSGNYTVYVTGTSGDAGHATFRVPSAPTLTLNPTSGTSGTAVTATGSNFAGTTCQLTSSPGGLFLSSSCSLSGGSLTTSSGFTVSSGAAVGTAYTVTVTTNLGGTDFATASFIVASGPLGTLTLVPTSGPIGTPVTGQASGFTTDTACQLVATPSSLLSAASCTITGGGNANVGFIVSSSATPGQYTVLVVGNTGKSAATTTPFTVTATPSFLLSANPNSLTLNPGGTANVVVSVLSYGGFSSPVALVASLPAGVSGVFAPNPVTPPSGGSVDSTLSLVVSGTATSTTTIITVAGAGGGFSTQTTITLVIISSATLTTTSTLSTATATSPWTPPKCVIATATFGSEAAPAVQFLRGFRDNLVLKTTAGSAFMQVFNAWYYSFSPSVAQFIASNDPIRAPIRVMLYPLLGVLGLSSFVYSLFSGAPEFGVVMAGLVASSLIGLVYLTLPALAAFSTLAKRRKIRITNIARVSLAVLAVALALLAIGEVAGSFLLLAVASSAIVLACIIAVPTIVAFAILRPNK